jgi:formate hydrogenlyase subunit 3/multisubunit Na+/H+ antiporter MnhD subunit
VEHSLTLSIGLPGQGMHLRIDPLSALFVALLLPQVAAAALAGMRRSLAFWGFVGALLLTVLAADAFTLMFGFGLMGVAAWAPARPGAGAAGRLSLALVGVACLGPAVFLPPGGVAFGLVLIGAGATAALAPLIGGRRNPPPAAVMSGGMVAVGLYVMTRYGFIVLGAAAQPWWGVALILAGAVGVGFGARRAMLQVDMGRLLAGATVAQTGLIGIGLGIALWAKALGEPGLAALALQGALLGSIAQALIAPLLRLGAGAVAQATGTDSLDWLGGLMRGMPRLGVLMLAGAAGMAALPLSPGFAPEFLLLHAVIAAAWTGGLLTGCGFAVLLALLGLAAGLMLGAGLRLIGVGFLGRPRTLRAAAAEDAGGATLGAMALLAGFCVPLALTPGLILAAIRPVIGQLASGAPDVKLGYQPLPVALLMGLSAIGAAALLRRFAVRGERQVPAWNGGFGKPPVWLPFGDPQTQPSATGLAEPTARALGLAMGGGRLCAAGWGRPDRRVYAGLARAADRLADIASGRNLALVVSALVLGLVLIGLGQAG